MTLKLTTLALGAVMAAGPALADLVIPSLSYRTGPFAAGGIPFADGYADYFSLLNERDGGIGGEPVRLIECETAYNTEKGVECYEATKGEGALIYQPLSTGITYQIIPKAIVDDIPIHTMGYGRTSASNGNVFSHVFNYPGHYWNGASGVVNYLLEINDGDMSGKKLALVYHNSAFGKEPIRTLEQLAEKHGFELMTLAVDHPGQEQKSQWLQIRRERPDYVTMWGWGIMNQVAIQEAANIRFPMENFIGVWWSGAQHDVIPAGEGSDGYKAITFHEVGADMPIFDDIQTHVVDKGLAAGAGDQIGTVLYNRGLYAAMLAAEAIKDAQAMTGVSDVTGGMVRDAMEQLSITEERMSSLGMPGFGPEFTVTCENHGGPGLVAVAQWDAATQTWSKVSDFQPTDAEVIEALVKEDSEAFAAENNIPTDRCNNS